MNAAQKTKWWIDLVLFGALLLAFYLDLTGVELHQWIGILGAELAIYHLVDHWSWVSAVTRRLSGKASEKARGYYALDAALLMGFAGISVTGLAISTWLDLGLANASAWLNVHIALSMITLVLVVLKIGVHGRWIVTVTRRIFGSGAAERPARMGAALERSAAKAPAGGVKMVERREFLKLMGIAGAAAIVAFSRAADSLQVDATEASGAGASPEIAATDVSSATTGSPSCTVQCSRRCSYPGHCQRYRDSNANGRCDLGECI